MMGPLNVASIAGIGLMAVGLGMLVAAVLRGKNVSPPGSGQPDRKLNWKLFALGAAIDFAGVGLFVYGMLGALS